MIRGLTVTAVLAAALFGCGVPGPLLYDGPVVQAGFSGQVVWAGTARPVAGALVLIGETEFVAETDDIFVDPATYVSPTGQPSTYWLTFAETIKVLYEDRTVIDEARVFSGIQPGPQASWLALSGQSVAFTAHGHLLPPDALNVSGYWGLQQVCALLPRYYNGA